MNYIWSFLGYNKNNDDIQVGDSVDIIDTFYKLYRINVRILPIDDCVLKGDSGKCELVFENKKIPLMFSSRHQEFFTMGGFGFQQLGSKRDKDVFYKQIKLLL